MANTAECERAARARPADSRRVVITGMGVISPFGVGVDALRRGLLEGRSAIAPVEGFDVSGLPCAIGGELPQIALEEHLEPRLVARLDYLSALSVLVARSAFADAGLAREERRDRGGVIFGTGFGSIPRAGELFAAREREGDSVLGPMTVPLHMPNAPSAHVAIDRGLAGPNWTCSTACSSASVALGQAFREIQSGRSDLMVAGGGDCSLGRTLLLSWSRMRILASAAGGPERASRPFDRQRKGLVVADSVVLFVLESAEAAASRKAPVLAQIAGYGMSCDARHLTRPSRDAQVRAMRSALEDSRLMPRDIDYVAAHGTGTRVGDRVEAEAIGEVLGEDVPVSANKSMIGHTMGASGAISVAACLFAMHEGCLPPTLNLDDPDPDCALNHVRRSGLQRTTRHALVNAFGFGGTNAVLALTHPDGD